MLKYIFAAIFVLLAWALVLVFHDDGADLAGDGGHVGHRRRAASRSW